MDHSTLEAFERVHDKFDRKYENLDRKYDIKIADLDKKYDEKNTKVVEQFQALRNEIGGFTGPIAGMATAVEDNKVDIGALEEKLDSFKTRLTWTILSCAGTIIMFLLNLAFGG
jgi:hypothetical protein